MEQLHRTPHSGVLHNNNFDATFDFSNLSSFWYNKYFDMGPLLSHLFLDSLFSVLFDFTSQYGHHSISRRSTGVSERREEKQRKAREPAKVGRVYRCSRRELVSWNFANNAVYLKPNARCEFRKTRGRPIVDKAPSIRPQPPTRTTGQLEGFHRGVCKDAVLCSI